MRDVAKAGDRALLVNAPFAPKTNNTVLLVISDPFFGIVRTPLGNLPAQWINEVDLAAWDGNPRCCMPTRCLIPLRGNPDALTVETEEGRSVKA